jgi:hypothetical protein
VLVAVLIFVTIFGLLLGALLSFSEVNIRTSSALKSYDARVYAADGGVEYGIQTVLTQPSICADVATPMVSLPDTVIDGKTVHVTCKTTAGFAASVSRWAVMTTNAAATSLTISNAAGTMKFITGPVYNAGTTQLQAQLEVDKGNFSQAGGPGCPAVDRPERLSFGAGFGFRCTSLTVSQADPKAILPCLAVSVCPGAIPPVNLPTNLLGQPDPLTPLGVSTLTCSVFRPGKYAVAPVLNSTSNYFVSGVYYFENIGTWLVAGGTTLFAGKQGSGETKLLAQTPCATDSAAGVSNAGTGAEFIFGGNSKFDVKNGHVEVFLRIPTGLTREGSAGVALRTVSAPAPTGYVASSGLSSLVEIENGANPDFAAHGLVYAPNAPILISATNNTGAQFLGGAVASTIDIGVAEPAEGFALSIPSFAPRTVTIISTAVASPGEKDITSKAVVEIPNDIGDKPVVDSWSTLNP